MYSLGKFLKMKYYDLLLEGDPNKIYVRSSDADRCIDSASVLVAGLNPPKDRWVWSAELPKWQPIAVHTVPQSDDEVSQHRAKIERPIKDESFQSFFC